jgi:hypothetical protein
MSNPKDGPMPQVEVPDAAVAFRKLEDFTRRMLAVPKKEIDARLEKEKKHKKNGRPKN